MERITLDKACFRNESEWRGFLSEIGVPKLTLNIVDEVVVCVNNYEITYNIKNRKNKLMTQSIKYYLKNTKDKAPVICIDTNGRSYGEIKQKFRDMLSESEKKQKGRWIIYRNYWTERKEIEELKL